MGTRTIFWKFSVTLFCIHLYLKIILTEKNMLCMLVRAQIRTYMCIYLESSITLQF